MYQWILARQKLVFESEVWGRGVEKTLKSHKRKLEWQGGVDGSEQNPFNNREQLNEALFNECNLRNFS